MSHPNKWTSGFLEGLKARTYNPTWQVHIGLNGLLFSTLNFSELDLVVGSTYKIKFNIHIRQLITTVKNAIPIFKYA